MTLPRHQVLPNAYIYKRDRSPYFYGYLNINGERHRKCLKSKDKSEAEQLLVQWKQELLLDDTVIKEIDYSFEFLAKKLIKKEEKQPLTQSGISSYKDTIRILYRKKGLVEFFANRDVRSIKKSDVEEFVSQLSLRRQKLGISTVKKHLNILRKVLNSADVSIEFPRITKYTKKPERRGYFTKEEYKKIRDESLKYVGHTWTERNSSVYEISEDLHDFLVFMMSSMLRPTVSEIYSLQHKHIHKMTTDKGTNYLEFSINRKNKPMTVQTLETGFHCYEKLVERRNQKKLNKEEFLFLPEYENRRHAMSIMSRMFNELLHTLDMKYGKLGEERTLYSLRHTAIIFNLAHFQDHFEVAKRADTSIKMIEDYYYPETSRDEKLSEFLRENL